MIRLARAQPGIAVLSFDLRCATPVLPVATGRNVSSPPRSLPKQAFNATRQQTASTEIPIASDARSLHTSRGFLPWRFAYAGPGVRRSTSMGPASANLHKLRRTQREQMSSELPLKADITQYSRHVSKVPRTEVRQMSFLDPRRAKRKTASRRSLQV